MAKHPPVGCPRAPFGNGKGEHRHVSENMNRRRRIIISILISFLVLVGVFCGLFYLWGNSLEDQYQRSPKNGLSDFFPDHIKYYKFDPTTILASLESGTTDVFVPETATPEAPVFDMSFSWGQSDYLEVANALYQHEWNETFDSWSLLSMIFETTCRDELDGFDSGDIHFFKIVETGSETRYTTREVYITPQYGNLSLGAGGQNADFLSRKPDWKSIDLNELAVSAEDAIRIAEANGGMSYRYYKHNECDIGMILNIGAYGGWYVWYEGIGDYSNFFIQIDPYKGRILESRTYIPTQEP